MSIWNVFYKVLFIIIFLFGNVFVFCDSFYDSLQTDFDLGSFNNTISHEDGHIILDTSGSNYYSDGEFESQIFDAGINSNLTSLKFSTPNYYKQDLPGNGGAEKDINMYGNVFLMNVNNDSIIADVAESYGLGLVGTFSSVSGKFGNALSFNGSNNIAFTDILVPSNEYTFSLWIKTNTKSRPVFTFSNETPSNSTYDRRLSIDASGHLVYYVYPNTGVTLTGTNTTVANNSWHHIAIVSKYNGSKYDINVYFDGSLDSSATNLNFGGYNGYTLPRLNLGNSGTFFLGALDDFAYYDRALSFDEIQDIYNSGDGLEFWEDDLIAGWRFEETNPALSLEDTSPTPKTFVYPTVTNNYLGIGYSPYNYYSLFSQNIYANTNYYLKTSQFYPPTAAMSISFWMKTKLDRKSILGWVGGMANNSVFIENGNLKWYFSSAPTYFASTSALNDGEWHHIVLTRNANNSRKIYVDGVLNNTSTSTYTIDNSFTTAVALYFFHSAVYSAGSGTLDQVSVWSRELVLDEISNIYKRGVGELRLQLKGCAISDCSDSVFVGPDGEDSYFELTNSEYDLSNLFSGFRYFQYASFFEVLDLIASKNISPKLEDVNLSYESAVVENSEPEILSLQICKDGCENSKYILPGLESFIVKLEINDSDGFEDLNLDSSILKIYSNILTSDSEDDWDHITLTNLINEDGEGCITEYNYICYLVSDSNIPLKFSSGATNVFFGISDSVSNYDNYELEYLLDENDVLISGIDMGEVLSLSIDTSSGNFSGNPGEENIPISTNTSENYIAITHEGNCDVNLYLVTSELIYSDYEFPISAFEWNLEDIVLENHLDSNETLIIEDWSRGVYPDSNINHIFLWLDMPPVVSGEYSGTFSFEVRN